MREIIGLIRIIPKQPQDPDRFGLSISVSGYG